MKVPTLKIALTGAHGTGKTTLARLLPSALEGLGKIAVCREAARLIIQHAGDQTFFQRGNNTLVRQSLIFIEQQIEERRQESGADIMITDRTFVDHLSYTATLFPDAVNTPEFAAMKRLSFESLARYDFIFKTNIEFPLVGDGVRESDEIFQAQIDNQLARLYAEAGKELIGISGSPEQRASKVMEKAKSFLSEVKARLAE